MLEIIEVNPDAPEAPAAPAEPAESRAGIVEAVSDGVAAAPDVNAPNPPAPVSIALAKGAPAAGALPKNPAVLAAVVAGAAPVNAVPAEIGRAHV